MPCALVSRGGSGRPRRQVELGLEDVAGEVRRPHPRWHRQSPCQNDLFTRDQRLAGIARPLTGTLKGNCVATAQHLSACWHLNGGLFIAMSAVGTRRNARDDSAGFERLPIRSLQSDHPRADCVRCDARSRPGEKGNTVASGIRLRGRFHALAPVFEGARRESLDRNILR